MMKSFSCASETLRSIDPLLQPVIHIALVLTCFSAVVLGDLSRELGLHFPKSAPLFFHRNVLTRTRFNPPEFGDRNKLRFWYMDNSFYVFNGTHYAPCAILNDEFMNVCKPRQLLNNPSVFTVLSLTDSEVMSLHKCQSVQNNGYCIAAIDLPQTVEPCKNFGDIAAFSRVIFYDLKDDGIPLGLFRYGEYIYAFLALTSDNKTVSVTRACSSHWTRPPRGIFPNYGAILKLKDCAANATFPIFVNFFKTSKYVSIGYLDDGGSIHLCVHNLTQIEDQFNSIRKQCDRARNSSSLWTISAEGRKVEPCVQTDRTYDCNSLNFLNQIVYYDKTDTYGAEYFQFDEIMVTPENPVQRTFDFEIKFPFDKSTLLISQKNGFFIINGMEDFNQNINPIIKHFNASLDYIDPDRKFVHLYKPNIVNSFTSHPIYSCEDLSQQQCILTPECIACGLECRTPENLNCPARRKIASNLVVDPLILSNGILEIILSLGGNIVNINVTLEAQYNRLIKINASYIPTTGRIKCKLNSWNDSLAFPFYKTINVFLAIDVAANSQPSLSRTEYFELTDIVHLVDPVLGQIVGNSILVDHTSAISFEFKRIASKHIQTVKIMLHNLTFVCPYFNQAFNCSLTFPSGIYWPGYAEIFVVDTLTESFPLQLNPYPIFYKTVWDTFPGYSVPFHFIGQYFYSFHNLSINLKLVNVTKLIKINCTINSDTEFYCKFNNFPAKLPVVGNFIFHSHSNPLTKLPNLRVNLNVPPTITSAVYSNLEKTIKITTSNYFADYISNTSISVVQCYFNCSETQCDQIVFSPTQNILTCNIETNYSANSSEWLALVRIGLHRLSIVVTIKTILIEKKEDKPKIISSFKLSIYMLLALILLLILALAVHYLRKEIDRFKLTSVSTRSSNVPRSRSRKGHSLGRVNSVTKTTEFRPFDSRESTMYNPEMLTNQFAFFTKRF